MTEVKPLSDEDVKCLDLHIQCLKDLGEDDNISQAESLERVRATITALKSENEKLRVALSDLVSDPLRYNGNRIEIDCASHAAAMGRVMRARAALAKG